MTQESTLDPQDWEQLRQTFHQAVDLCINQMQSVTERPVWQPTPGSVKDAFQAALPHAGEPLEHLLSVFKEQILPYGTGNTHPRFWGWVHGSGTAAGAFAEMLAGFMNCNMGGRDQVGLYLELQVLAWCREIFGFPDTASGVLTTGTSVATLIALTVARNAKAEGDVQRTGVASGKKRVGYTSSEAHSCIAKTFDLLGLGKDALRMVPVDAAYRMQPAVLATMIAEDRAAGFQPFVVIASAGTVNTGAIDPLAAIHQVCEAQGLWLHVDAAFGGLAILTSAFQSVLKPISKADSLAFDFHKWLHVPYDAGCVLVRDAAAHRKAFSARREYLASAQAGLAGGDTWFCDYGPELSRGFRALKVWFTLKAYGVNQLGEMIAKNCQQAASLAAMVTTHPELELLSNVTLNIVCFRFVGALQGPGSAASVDTINTQIVRELHLQGIAAPSMTEISGKKAIRVCITNHRTRHEDLVCLVDAVLTIGKTLSS